MVVDVFCFIRRIFYRMHIKTRHFDRSQGTYSSHTPPHHNIATEVNETNKPLLRLRGGGWHKLKCWHRDKTSVSKNTDAKLGPQTRGVAIANIKIYIQHCRDQNSTAYRTTIVPVFKASHLPPRQLFLGVVHKAWHEASRSERSRLHLVLEPGVHELEAFLQQKTTRKHEARSLMGDRYHHFHTRGPLFGRLKKCECWSKNLHVRTYGDKEQNKTQDIDKAVKMMGARIWPFSGK